MRFRPIVFILIIFAITGCSTAVVKSSPVQDNAHKTELLYNRFIEGNSPDIAQLNLFLYKMPKGGDLHHHYAGSIYAETFLDWVEAAGFWIDKNTLEILRVKTDDCVSVKQLRSKTKLYRKLLTLWSDKDYQNHDHLQLSSDAKFFSTFNYFISISGFSCHEGLMILKERAIRENVSYIETMFKSVGYHYSDQSFDENLRKAAEYKTVSSLLDKLSAAIDKDNTFQEKINSYVTLARKAHEGIDDDRFMMRFQTYTIRGHSPCIVFSALYAGFKAAEASEFTVGVNILGPENGVVALADYTLHMRMFHYLKNKFPKVHRALHAGELTLGMVRPRDLNFHITQAVNIAGAQRIGHGVDLPYEKDAIHLLKQIKEESVIEINLTSNEFILGVKGRKHPYLIYSAYDVPMVICTDDSGVSRDNLTHEYVLLVSRYKPGYKTLKKYVYNSIRYSFLSESEKESLTHSLDVRFKKFEAEMADYYDVITK